MKNTSVEASVATEGDAQAEQEKLLRLEIQSLERQIQDLDRGLIALRKENEALKATLTARDD